MAKPRRRQAGEGGISEYMTKAGPRFLIKFTAQREDGTKRVVLKRGFKTRRDAAAALREQLGQVDRGTHVAPSKVTVDRHFATWLDGLRKGPTTIASYRKNVRLHVIPYIGDVQLAQLTGTRLTALYRQLETSGRADGAGGLGARTVRYIHTIMHSALAAAVDDNLIAVNPAAKAKPPTAKEAKSPEMQTWDADQLRTFLDWAERERPELYPAWLLLAMTGMRRGEALAVRWGDVDFEAGTLAVRRSAVLVKAKGEGERLEVGPPKSGKSRVIDLDGRTLAALRAHRAQRGALSLALAGTTPTSSVGSTAVCVTPSGCPGSSPGSWPRRPGSSGTPCRRQSGCTTCGTPTPRSTCAPACTRRSSASAWGTPPSRSPWTSTSTRCRRCSARPLPR